MPLSVNNPVKIIQKVAKDNNCSKDEKNDTCCSETGRPCSRHRRSSSRLWNDKEETCGLPHRKAPSSISSSNLIQRAFSCHAHSWLSPSRNSSSSTNICSKNLARSSSPSQSSHTVHHLYINSAIMLFIFITVTYLLHHHLVFQDGQLSYGE